MLQSKVSFAFVIPAKAGIQAWIAAFAAMTLVMVPELECSGSNWKLHQNAALTFDNNIQSGRTNTVGPQRLSAMAPTVFLPIVNPLLRLKPMANALSVPTDDPDEDNPMGGDQRGYGPGGPKPVPDPVGGLIWGAIGLVIGAIIAGYSKKLTKKQKFWLVAGLTAAGILLGLFLLP